MEGPWLSMVKTLALILREMGSHWRVLRTGLTRSILHLTGWITLAAVWNWTIGKQA